jgi:hypothetical protein
MKDMDDGMDDKGELCIEKDGKGVWLHLRFFERQQRHDGEQQRNERINGK